MIKSRVAIMVAFIVIIVAINEIIMVEKLETSSYSEDLFYLFGMKIEKLQTNSK